MKIKKWAVVNGGGGGGQKQERTRTRTRSAMDYGGHTLGQVRQSKRHSDSDLESHLSNYYLPNHLVYVHHVPRLARQP